MRFITTVNINNISNKYSTE